MHGATIKTGLLAQFKHYVQQQIPSLCNILLTVDVMHVRYRITVL